MTTRQLCHFSGRTIRLKGKAGARDQRYTCVALITWRDNHVSVANRAHVITQHKCPIVMSKIHVKRHLGWIMKRVVNINIVFYAIIVIPVLYQQMYDNPTTLPFLRSRDSIEGQSGGTWSTLHMCSIDHVSVAGVITRTQIAAKHGCESQLNLKAVLQLQLSINKESLHGVNVPI